MKHILIITFCLKLLGDLAYKIDLVRDVEEKWNPITRKYEIIRVLPKGVRLKDEKK